MKKLLSIVLSLAMIVGILCSIPVFADETTTPQTYDGRIETLFNNDWQFWRESSGSTKTTYEAFAAKDVEFENINLPHDFSIETPFSTISTNNRSGCLQGGTGWYKKTFTMPSELKDKRIVINFDGVYSYSYIYVNGTQVGSNVMGYISFAFDITDYLNFGFDKTNEIVVKVINAVPSERWYSGSGIYRDVTLIITDPVHVDYRGTAVSMPNLASTNGADGTLSAAVTVKNDSATDTTATVKTTIEKDGEAVGTSAEKEITVAAGSKATATLAPVVENPALWSVKTPNLYNLKTEVSVDGKVVDTYNTTFGYKYLEFDKDSGFFLNGEPMKLKGVALHNDVGASLGTKAYDTAVKRYIDLVKDMGCNAIRTAHQSLSQNLMNYCAEAGIMVFDEVFDEWIHAKVNDTGSYTGYFASGIEATNKLLLTE
ncbi:MAG: glycoside hydrolase family 2 protein, partial [Acutalibacteraceae bacterium]